MATLRAALEAMGDRPLRAVFMSEAERAVGDGSALLQTRVLALSAFAEALKQHLAGVEPEGDDRPRLCSWPRAALPCQPRQAPG
jgi:hypothetical protein